MLVLRARLHALYGVRQAMQRRGLLADEQSEGEPECGSKAAKTSHARHSSMERNATALKSRTCHLEYRRVLHQKRQLKPASADQRAVNCTPLTA